MLLERGLEVDHSTINRWVLAYAPSIERRLRMFRKPHCGSVRIDETYIRVRGQWRYLYRAIDKHGEAVDFLLTAKRDLDAAKRFFRKMLQDHPLLSPDRIGTDGAGSGPDGGGGNDSFHQFTYGRGGGPAAVPGARPGDRSAMAPESGQSRGCSYRNG